MKKSIKKICSGLILIVFLMSFILPTQEVKAANGYKVPHVVGFNPSALAAGYYTGGVMANGSASATEADVQFYVTKAGTFSMLSANVTAQNATGDSTLTFRINGADGNNTITFASGVTGLVQDTTHTDTVAVGDLINFQLSYTAGTATFSSWTIMFESDDGSTIQFLMSAGAPASFTTNSTTRYVYPVGGFVTNLTTETNVQNMLQHNTTASNFACYVSANARTTNTVFRVRKNTANGNGVVTFGSTASGLIRDTSNSDSLVAGDLINYSFATSTGGNGITIKNCQLTLTSDNTREITHMGGSAFTRSSTASSIFGRVIGSLGLNSGTEAQNRVYLGVDGDVSKWAIYVSANASNRNMDIHFRVTGADGNNTVTNTLATTGWLQDTTNTDSITSSDYIAFRSIVNAGGAGTGNVTYNAVSFLVTFTLISPTFTQSAYRLFANTNTTDVGSALAVQDTGATLATVGDAFRLRLLTTVSTIRLDSSGENFKLQYVDKGSGSCASPSGGTPSSYTDVTTGTLISYNDNATPTDDSALTANASDPTNGGNTIVNQTYEELNNFTNSQGQILTGQEGKWDFSLKDNSATAGATYCLRAVKSDGTVFGTYTVYPEISIPGASQSISFSISDNTVGFGSVSSSQGKYATGDTNGNTSETVAHTFDVNTNATGGYVVKIQGDTLKNGSHSITSCGASCTPSTGTEQFGLRVTASGGIGAVSSPYNHASNYAYEGSASVADDIASASSGDGVTTTYSVRYLTNVASTTEAGTYSGAYTYTVTPSF